MGSHRPKPESTQSPCLWAKKRSTSSLHPCLPRCPTTTDDGPRCYALILDATDGGAAPALPPQAPFYCSKITSVKAYMAMNREVRERRRKERRFDKGVCVCRDAHARRA